MTSVNISIKKEAYDFLRRMKSKDKSFSDVILEMKNSGINKKGSKEHILKFAGVLKDSDVNWNEVDERIRDFRKSFNERVERTRKYMNKK